MTRGYRPPLPVIERLENKTSYEGDCWRWTGSHNADGYGHIRVGSRIDGTRTLLRVHQAAYREALGPIPEGLEIDHVYAWGCRFRDCWRPSHLEAVTHNENVQAHRVSPAEHQRRVEHMRQVQMLRWVP